MTIPAILKPPGGFKRRRIYLTFGGWILLVFLLWRMMDRLPGWSDWSRFSTPENIKAALIFCGLFAVATMLRALRFGFLIRRSVRVSWRHIAVAFPWLFFLGALTPFRSGEGMRGIWVRRHNGDTPTVIGYWLGERVTDTLALVVMIFFGAGYAPAFGVESETVIKVIGLAFAISYVTLWFFLPHLSRIISRLGALRRIGIDRLLESFSYMRHARTHFSMVVLTCAIWLVMALAFYQALRTMVGDLPVASAFLALGFVNLASLVSGAPGNVGSYQAAMVGALAAYHIKPESAFMASVILHGSNLAITITMGLASRVISLWLDKRDKSVIRENC
jgi:uncharacterized membrane protein YbhN (UPF0104 family)